MSERVDMARALKLAKSLAGATTKNARADIVEELAAVGGFARRTRGATANDIVPIERFSPEQQEVLREVARAGADMLAAKPAGVPSLGWDFRPWTGIGEARVLESRTSTKDGAKPRWLVIQEAGLAGAGWSTASAGAFEGLDAAGCVDTVFLMATGAYALRTLFPECRWTEELDHVVATNGDAGGKRAEELVLRMGAEEAFLKSVAAAEPAVFEPLFLAVHTRGKPIPPAIHGLIRWSERSRPLLAALSPEERASMVTGVTEYWGAPNLEMDMDNLEALADLLVTPDLLTHLRAITEGDEELESQYAERLDALGRRFG